MKKSIYTLIIACTFITGTTLLTSCGSDTKNESESSEQHDMDGHNHDDMASADHSCPMHPEVTGKKDDKCSKCGMFLTKTSENEDGEMKEHMHDMDTVAYSCPMHPDEKGMKGDTCSKCKMDLTASADKMSMKGCNHKDGKTCGMCTKEESMKCDHKKRETCPNCKKA